MSDRRKWGRRYRDNQAYPKDVSPFDLPKLDYSKVRTKRIESYRSKVRTKRIESYRDVEPTMLKEISKFKGIIYGSKAINAQVDERFQRAIGDIDVFSTTPRTSAYQLRNALIRKHGKGFYVDSFEHDTAVPGKKGITYRVREDGLDNLRGTRDDIQLLDASRMPRFLRSVKIGEIRFAHIDDILKDKKESVADERSAHRLEKDLADIARIEIGRKNRHR